ncbi:hypothetical protein [Lysobacter gummosus]
MSAWPRCSARWTRPLRKPWVRVRVPRAPCGSIPSAWRRRR